MSLFHDYNDVFWNYRLMQMKQIFSWIVIVTTSCGVKGWLGVGFSKFCQIDCYESGMFGYFTSYYHDYNDVFWNYRLMQMWNKHFTEWS